MRPDLLDAQAAIDWTKAQLPSFEQRLDAWMDDNLYVRVKETEPDTADNVVEIAHREFFPLSFNVEVGAYINTIRSALDMLATSLYLRNGGEYSRRDKIYFPIVKTASNLEKNRHWKELKTELPVNELRIIEELEPWNGGHKFLYPLHQFDNRRKHQRLIFASIVPTQFTIKARNGFTPLSSGAIEDYDKTVIGLIKKGSPEPDIIFTPKVFFFETDILPKKPVIRTLYEFAGSVNAIIKLFNTP